MGDARNFRGQLRELLHSSMISKIHKKKDRQPHRSIVLWPIEGLSATQLRLSGFVMSGADGIRAQHHVRDQTRGILIWHDSLDTMAYAQ
jgi:hypothetical protein